MLKNLQIKKEKEKNKPEVEWIRTIIGNKNPKFKKEDNQPKFQEPNPDVQYIKTIKGKEKKPLKYEKFALKKDNDNNKKKVLTIPDTKILDKDLLKEVPYFNDTIVVDETDKLKKREAIIYEIIKQLPADNDKYFVEYKPETDTYNIGKDKKKNLLKMILIIMRKEEVKKEKSYIHLKN